jgi:23S rRNA pseudouridine2605 synthase
MLNKPRGYLTTMRDERGRKTVVELVSGLSERVYPVGRLDLESEGLLLMTNDGLFANKVAHPSFNKTKTYDVRVRGDAPGAARLLRRPLLIDSHPVQAKSVDVLERTADGGVLRLSVSEGRNRQIRKMCAQCGLVILSLKRVSIGDVELGSLGSGQWRHLTEAERNSLCVM